MLPIAIGGSAANPATIGHYKLIEWLLNSGKFSKVIWILSGERKDKQLLDPDHRVAITLLTFPQEWFLREDVRFVISFEDVYGENKPTIEWLEKMKAENPDHKIVWYTGADSVEPRDEFGGKCEVEARWVRGAELMQNHDFLIFPRPGYANPRTLSLPSNFEVANIDVPEVSSTEVRRRIAMGENFGEMMSSHAAEYIRKHKLYGYQ